MVGTVGNTEGKVQKEENSFEVLLNLFQGKLHREDEEGKEKNCKYLSLLYREK